MYSQGCGGSSPFFGTIDFFYRLQRFKAAYVNRDTSFGSPGIRLIICVVELIAPAVRHPGQGGANEERWEDQGPYSFLQSCNKARRFGCSLCVAQRTALRDRGLRTNRAENQQECDVSKNPSSQ
jgi:hypothetical protein